MKQKLFFLNQLLFVLLVVSSLQVESRGRREKAEPSPEREVESCLVEYSSHNLLMVKALNAAGNPLAEKVESIDKQKYCQCFGAEFYTFKMQKKAGAIVGGGGLEDMNPIYIKCAMSSASNGMYSSQSNPLVNPTTKPVVGNAKTTNTNTNSNTNSITTNTYTNSSIPSIKPAVISKDSNFKLLISECSKSPQSYFTIAEVHLKSMRSPRADRVKTMDAEKYCNCLYNIVRRELGDDLAYLALTNAATSDKDLFRTSQAKNKAIEICSAQQIPFNQ